MVVIYVPSRDADAMYDPHREKHAASTHFECPSSDETMTPVNASEEADGDIAYGERRDQYSLGRNHDLVMYGEDVCSKVILTFG